MKSNCLFKQYITKQVGIIGYLKIWGEAFRTKKIQLLFFEINQIKRVGGAYAALIVNPQLIQTIIVIYNVLVDSFNKEDLYYTCAYSPLRGIMRMHSDKNNRLVGSAHEN